VDFVNVNLGYIYIYTYTNRLIKTKGFDQCIVVVVVVVKVQEVISYKSEVNILVTSAFGGTNNGIMFTVLVI
jgi:hypothetical protein